MTKPGTPLPIDNPNKQDTQHPAISGTLLQTSRLNRGPVAEVDYDLEPFTVRRANDSGGSKSKPADDLATNIQAARARAARTARGIF
jgi:hypothetical protein